MIHNYFLALLLFVGFLTLQSCDKRPDYPVTPHIELVEATNYKLPSTEDSFHIVLNFQDGDGDLGLNQNDEPRSEFKYNFNSKGDTIEIPGGFTDCNTQVPLNGKVYSITRNPNFYNFFISILIKNPDKTYTKKPIIGCNEYNGRFSRFDPDKTYKGPLEGQISYNFTADLLDRPTVTIALEFTIQDRAQHKAIPSGPMIL